MAQAKTFGMKEIAEVSGKRAPIAPQSPPCTVKGIAHQGVSCGGKVYADLMRSPGLDRYLQKAGIGTALKNADSAQCSLAGGTGSMDCSQARVRYRPDGCRDGKFGLGRNPTGQCPIDFDHLRLPHGCAKNRPGPGGAGKEDHSRGAPPEAMDGRGFRVALLHQPEECVFKESPTRDGRKPTGFCHGQQVFVFVKNSVGKGYLRFVPGRAPPKEHLAGFQNGIGLHLETIHGNLTELNALLPVPSR